MTTPACPKCRHAVAPTAIECPSCGLVFAKWRPATNDPAAAVPSPPPAAAAPEAGEAKAPYMPVGLYLEGRFLRWGRLAIALWILSFVLDILFAAVAPHPVTRLSGFSDLLLTIGILLFGFGGVMAAIRENAAAARG